MNVQSMINITHTWLLSFVKQEADWSEERQTACIFVITDGWIYRQSHRNGEAAQSWATS